MAGQEVISTLEQATIVRISLRLLPFRFASYFVAYIDRANVKFAALSMNKALGLSAQQYGLAAGLFFLGYLFFEIPSNLILARMGARRGDQPGRRHPRKIQDPAILMPQQGQSERGQWWQTFGK